MIVKLMSEYESCRKDVTWHITHKYTREMSRRSTTVSPVLIIMRYNHLNTRYIQVPLGVLPLNENNFDEMCQILDKLQSYCKRHKKSGGCFRGSRHFCHKKKKA